MPLDAKAEQRGYVLYVPPEEKFDPNKLAPPPTNIGKKHTFEEGEADTVAAAPKGDPPTWGPYSGMPDEVSYMVEEVRAVVDGIDVIKENSPMTRNGIIFEFHG